MRYTWVCIILAIGGCRERSGDPFRDGAPSVRQANETPVSFSDAVSCAHKKSWPATVTVAAAIIPKDYSQRKAVQDTDWVPGRILDVRSLQDKLVAVDAMLGNITWFLPNFQSRLTRGAKGQGPGEFKAPIAIAAHRFSGTVSVNDYGLHRVSLFNGEGRFVGSRAWPQGDIADAVMAPNGDLYVSYTIWPRGNGRGDSAGKQTILEKINDAGRQAIASVASSAVDRDPRFVLPGPNSSRITLVNDGVLLSYPAAGVIERYTSSGMSRFMVCMDSKVARAYKKQRDYIRRTGVKSEQAVELVSDVLEDADGNLYVVSSLPDANGNIHIDQFALNGRETGSIVAPAKSLSRPRNVRFGRHPKELLAFGLGGTILRLEVN